MMAQGSKLKAGSSKLKAEGSKGENRDLMLDTGFWVLDQPGPQRLAEHLNSKIKSICQFISHRQHSELHP